ncbi:competence protein ComK [Bacillus sp. JJ1764]|uniref:competence protein ComK n=1 Tax=Bacillus sp. JJ1764 TaxID=3122964 RepID=UPI0030006487
MKNESNRYFFNEKTILITGEYDKTGKLVTRIIEGEDTFLVDQPPLKIIEKNLLLVGSNLKGARKSSMEILGPHLRFYPLAINSHLDIFLLPTRSGRKSNCVWFSLAHIKKQTPIGTKKTEVVTSYGHVVEIELRTMSFNNRIKNAKYLRDSIISNTLNPLNLYLEPKMGFFVCEDAGENKYTIRFIDPEEDDEDDEDLEK